MSLASVMDARVARGNRQPNWSVSDAWADIDPTYRRAMIPYVGRGGGPVAADNVTFFLEIFPPGCRGGLHAHPDGEEMYFVLQGEGVCITCELGDDQWSILMSRGDLVSIPAGVMRQLVNTGNEDAHIAVIFGSGNPQQAVLSPKNDFLKAVTGGSAK